MWVGGGEKKWSREKRDDEEEGGVDASMEAGHIGTSGNPCWNNAPPPHTHPSLWTISRLMSEQLAGSTQHVCLSSCLFNHSLSWPTIPHFSLSPSLSPSRSVLVSVTYSHPSHPAPPLLPPLLSTWMLFMGGALFCLGAQNNTVCGAIVLCLETEECQNAREWWMLGKYRSWLLTGQPRIRKTECLSLLQTHDLWLRCCLAAWCWRRTI